MFNVSRRFVGRLLAGVSLALWTTLAGCGAAWLVEEKTEHHALPRRVTLYVAMSPAVAEADSGLAAAVVDALSSRLTQRGYEVPIVVARLDEKPPVPRLELQIVDSAGGDTVMRGAGQFGGVFGLPASAAGVGTGIAGASHITVDCYVVSAAGVTTFRGRVSASTFGNTTGHDAIEAGETVGLSIARTVAE
ncbi:MAG TPA: hypothetical protein VFZ53_30160 [Polyangiaceae bacterium]